MPILMYIFQILSRVGHLFLGIFSTTGRIGLFSLHALWHIASPPFYGRNFLKQLIFIGYYSLPVIGMTAIFIGSALALQIYIGSSRFSAESTVPGIVVLGLTRELGPVLAGLMLAGRAGVAMAAELSNMRVTEQIDALITLNTDPIKYLVAPRILASTLVLPLLVIVTDVLGVFGGYIISVYSLDFNSSAYLNNTYNFMETQDIVSGLVKAAVFGFLIALLGCYHGYNSSSDPAISVRRATTHTMVASSMIILITNYIITQIFFST